MYGTTIAAVVEIIAIVMVIATVIMLFLKLASAKSDAAQSVETAKESVEDSVPR